MLSPTTETALDGQYALPARACVRDGRWAALWRLDGGPSVSVTPVMLLLARGYRSNGAFTTRTRLRELAGVGARALARAEASLASNALIEPLGYPRSRSLEFRVRDGILSTHPRTGFFFPGRIVTSGLWAELSPGERCTLFALAGELRGRSWDGHDIEYEPDWLTEFIASHNSQRVYEIPNPHDEDDEDWEVDEDWKGWRTWVPRFGVLSFTRLAERTGMNRGSVWRAVEKLQQRASGELVAALEVQNGTFYHLPDKWWAPRLTRR